jgi:hypothetical protein
VSQPPNLPDWSSEETSRLSRRTLLAILGAAGAAAFLAACENDGSSSKTVRPLPDPADPTRGNRALVIEPPGTYIPPTPRKDQLPPPPVKVEPPQNTYGILPRSMWAKAGPDLKRIEPMDGVRLLTFHHSGDPKPFLTSDFGETAQHLEYVREYHRDRNFNDIGYHFAIDRAGRVWQLRSLRYQGQHVRYNNEHNIGVVVLGNFDLQSMTSQQKEKVKAFGSILRKQYSLPVSRVYTHQEIVKTECPGDNMQPYMVAIRKQHLI